MRTMILLSSHSPSVIKPSQAMGAASREPRRGEIPVMTENCCQLEAFRNKKKGDPVKQ
jgi:hypothetical protein